MELNIPESGDGTPDLLDEILWNLRWMLAMQDPGDGGVYHKCTNANFDGMVMPHQATSTRYVVQKSTAAALDFAAVMAQAARILDDGGWSWAPTLADSCLAAALSAWEWAWANPDAYYRQGDMNALYNPDINTGEYGDGNVSDEFDWAAMELFATTGDPAYLADAEPFAESSTSLPGWPNVRTLGYYSLLHLRRSLPAGAVDTTALKARVLGMADWHKAGLATSPYGIVMGRQNSDFGWGSNSQAANQAVALILAFRMTADSSYLWAALSNLDYLLGRNATGYSFVTGWGDKTPLHIHHRPSEADGVRDPVPGLLAGGPNPRQEDGCAGYPSKLPAVSYVDAMCSYASNEICINWNAPLVFAAWAMEALLAPDGRPDLTAVPEERPPQAASGIRLRPNFPNPFNASTSFDFRIDRPAGVCVTLTVYDAAGRRVAECLRGERFEPGAHRIRFEGGSLPSGAYLYRLEADGEILGGKMALVK
jgi:endoglucanase